MAYQTATKRQRSAKTALAPPAKKPAAKTAGMEGAKGGFSGVSGKGVTFNATASHQILSISGDPGASNVTDEMPTRVQIENDGAVPVYLMVGYKSYTADTTEEANDYLHVLVPPGTTYDPPVRAVLHTNASSAMMKGTVVSNATPDSNMYVDTGIDLNDDGTPSAGIVGSASATTIYMTPFTSETDNSVNKFRVNDVIRINNEIMEVTAVGSGADAENDYLTVRRGVYGSDASASHADGAAIRLAFFNQYHNYNKFSTCRTDSDGKFKCSNFFGLGRTTTGHQGITAGSFAIKFFTEGAYQSLGLHGITPSTHSGLAASTEYGFSITCDDNSQFVDLSFTTDSENLNFGANNGVIQKINDALKVQYYTAGNLFEKSVSCSIHSGDIRITSNSNLTTSAISLANPTGVTNVFGVGRFPAVGNISGAVASRVPDNVVYDKVTYNTKPNPVFGYDDSEAGITGICQGSMNYETGGFDIWGAPPNAEFLISGLHTSAFSGRLRETGVVNSLREILANTPQQFAAEASVKVKVI